MKKSGIAFGQRTKQNGANDTQDLIELASLIKDKYKMDFKREWYVGFHQEGYLCRIVSDVGVKESRRFRWKNPDLLCVDRDYGTIIIELDGRIHDVKVAKTDERNSLFRGAGIKLIVLNIADIGYHNETIWERCDFELMNIVGKRNLPEYNVVPTFEEIPTFKEEPTFEEINRLERKIEKNE